MPYASRGVAVLIGCGFCEKTVHGRAYLYFWHYESRGSRREQAEEYIGPARSPRARGEVSRLVAAYVDRAQGQMAQFLRDTRARMAGP